MDRHKVDNIMIGIRARKAWVAWADAQAQKRGESRMAFIRKAVEERIKREDERPLTRD